MIINAIRYKLSNGEERYYRFKRLNGAFRRFICHQGQPAELKEFSQAMSYVLTQSPDAPFIKASLNLIDADGISWVVDRQPSGVKVYRNRKLHPDGLSATFFNHLFDLDITGEHESIQPADIFQCLALNHRGKELIAHPDAKLLEPNEDSESSDLISQMTGDIFTKILRLMPEFKRLQPEDIISLASALEPHYRALNEIDNQVQILKKTSLGSSNVDEDYIDSLKQQMEIIESIEDIGKEALKPGNALSLMSKKYQDINEKLQDLCAQMDLVAGSQQGEESQEAALAVPRPWEKLINVLTRLKLYEHLTRASEHALSKMQSNIKPVLAAYYETVDTFLRNDTQITSELESCLGLLTTQLGLVKPHPSAPASLLSSLRNRLLPQAKTEPMKSAPAAPSDQSLPQSASLDQARMAVDYALGRLGELHANLQSHQHTHKEVLDEIEGRHEKVIAELGRLKSSWKQLAAKYRLPESCSLKTLLLLLRHQARLEQLVSQRQTLTIALEDQKNRLVKLATLIQEWRSLTSSIKDAPLDQPQNILSETKALLDYASKKKNQISKLQKLAVEFHSQQKIHRLHSMRLKMVSDHWHREFADRKQPPIKATHKAWPQVFSLVHILEYLQTQLGESEGGRTGAAIFQSSDQEWPLVFYYLQSNKIPNHIRSLFIQYLKSSNTLSQGVLLLADEHLAEEISKMGVSQSVPVQPERREPEGMPALARPEPHRPGKSVLSQRAQDALKVLAGKATSPSNVQP